jgi:hypothetical protein
MMSVGVEYPALPSTVECVGVVGFILRLKAQVFSLILYKWVDENLDGTIGTNSSESSHLCN